MVRARVQHSPSTVGELISARSNRSLRRRQKICLLNEHRRTYHRRVSGREAVLILAAALFQVCVQLIQAAGFR